jgi:lysylphosphatidylglycerol synthetase-like protein (DUF2156 family)
VTDSAPNKRPLIGVITLVCLGAAVVSATLDRWNAASAAALFRVATVMGALWLAYPAFADRAVWQKFYRRVILILIVTAVFINRLRFFLPLLLVVLIVIWFVRPKKKRYL